MVRLVGVKVPYPPFEHVFWAVKYKYSAITKMTIMDISEVSRKVYQLQKERIRELGVKLTPELVFFHLSEEIGQIARQLVNRNLPMRNYEEENLKEEMVQAILDLLVLYEVFDVDLPAALNRGIDKMAKRMAKRRTSP